MGQAKRNQNRHCPGLGEIITPATCASQRQSQIACPQDCPHNPFNPANYLDSYQTVEDEAVRKLSFLLYQDPTFKHLSKIKKAVFSGDQFLANHQHAWHIHGEKRFAKWLKQGDLKNWKNDEMVMAHSLGTIRGTFIEFQGALDDRRSLVRDLLRPDEPPFVLIDVSMVKKSCRFDVALTWVYQIPGSLMRLSGVASKVEEFGTIHYPDAFKILLKHLGVPDIAPEPWILENMLLIQKACYAVQIGRLIRQYEISDLVICEQHCQLSNKFSRPIAEILKQFMIRLLSYPSVVDDSPGVPGSIFRGNLLTKSTPTEEASESVGEITLFPDGRLHLNSTGRKKFAELIKFIRKIEPALVVTSETFEDVGKEIIAETSLEDADLVPPALLEDISEIVFSSRRISNEGGEEPLLVGLQSSFKNFADIPIPALDDRTPRDAASDPLLRTRLIHLMKRHVNMVDHERRTNEVDFDLNPLLEELGLHEIIFQPSPCGRREIPNDSKLHVI